MGQTIAEALREEGKQEERIRSRQQTLLRQLRGKFGDVPKKTVQAIKATTEVKQLNTWLDRVVAVKTLEEMHIGPAE